MIEFFGLDVFTWAVLGLLAFVVPLWSKSEMKHVRERLAGGDPHARIRQFDSTMRWEWGMTAALLVAWTLLDRPLVDLGLGLAPTGGEWIAILVGLALGMAAVVHSLRTEHDDDQIAALGDQLGDLELLAARGPAERRRFVALSFTAGICEELIYRGVLMSALALHIGVWPAAVVSSAVFGVAHAYQGRSGIVRTGIVGLVLAVLAIATGSLWVPMIVHVLVDVFQGRVLSRAVERRVAFA